MAQNIQKVKARGLKLFVLQRGLFLLSAPLLPTYLLHKEIKKGV